MSLKQQVTDVASGVFAALFAVLVFACVLAAVVTILMFSMASCVAILAGLFYICRFVSDVMFSEPMATYATFGTFAAMVVWLAVSQLKERRG